MKVGETKGMLHTVCSTLVFNAVDTASRISVRLHLWPTWFDFVKISYLSRRDETTRLSLSSCLSQWRVDASRTAFRRSKAFMLFATVIRRSQIIDHRPLWSFFSCGLIRSKSSCVHPIGPPQDTFIFYHLGFIVFSPALLFRNRPHVLSMSVAGWCCICELFTIETWSCLFVSIVVLTHGFIIVQAPRNLLKDSLSWLPTLSDFRY